MKATHYIIRVIKQNRPILIIEQATLAGFLKSVCELEKQHIRVAKGRTKNSVKIEVDCIATGTKLNDPVGCFYLRNESANDNWVNTIEKTFIANRLD